MNKIKVDAHIYKENWRTKLHEHEKSGMLLSTNGLV